MNTDKFVWGSVEHQKEVCRLIGYDFSKWNPDDQEQVMLLGQKASKALISRQDRYGWALSPDDLSLLSTMTGRG